MRFEAGQASLRMHVFLRTTIISLLFAQVRAKVFFFLEEDFFDARREKKQATHDFFRRKKTQRNLREKVTFVPGKKPSFFLFFTALPFSPRKFIQSGRNGAYFLPSEGKTVKIGRKEFIYLKSILSCHEMKLKMPDFFNARCSVVGTRIALSRVALFRVSAV